MGRYVQIGVASFGSIVDWLCGSKPGRFSRLTYDVMQWIRKVKVESWQHKIEMQLQKGVWCGFRGSWSASYSKIPYDKLLHSSTNMVNVGVPLDTESGAGAGHQDRAGSHLPPKYYI